MMNYLAQKGEKDAYGEPDVAVRKASCGATPRGRKKEKDQKNSSQPTHIVGILEHKEKLCDWFSRPQLEQTYGTDSAAVKIAACLEEHKP